MRVQKRDLVGGDGPPEPVVVTARRKATFRGRQCGEKVAHCRCERVRGASVDPHRGVREELKMSANVMGGPVRGAVERAVGRGFGGEQRAVAAH